MKILKKIARKKGTLIYINGDIYNGELKNGFRDGNGMMKYNNGDVYNGEWYCNLKDGIGIMKYNNGDIYYGGWSGDIIYRNNILRYIIRSRKLKLIDIYMLLF